MNDFSKLIVRNGKAPVKRRTRGSKYDIIFNKLKHEGDYIDTIPMKYYKSLKSIVYNKGKGMYGLYAHATNPNLCIVQRKRK